MAAEVPALRLEEGGKADEEDADAREVLLFRAVLCEQTERYDELLETGFELAETCEGELTRQERHMVTVAFKNGISPLRTSWRLLTGKNAGKDGEAKREYRDEHVTPKLKELLRKVIATVERLEETVESDEGYVFLLKLRGDYYRYLLELEERVMDVVVDEVAAEAVECYNKGKQVSEECLLPTDPLRLGLALNFAVFYYDICNNPERAIYVAKLAFDAAVAELADLDPETYKDATLLLQLIRDNITLWTAAMPDDEEDFNVGSSKTNTRTQPSGKAKRTHK